MEMVTLQIGLLISMIIVVKSMIFFIILRWVMVMLVARNYKQYQKFLKEW